MNDHRTEGISALVLAQELVRKTLPSLAFDGKRMILEERGWKGHRDRGCTSYADTNTPGDLISSANTRREESHC